METILLSVTLATLGILLTVYIIDILRLKRLRMLIPSDQFLVKLKHNILKDILRDKNQLFFTSIALTLLFFVFLLLQSPGYTYTYQRNYASIIGMNASKFNVNQADMEDFAEDNAVKSAKRVSGIIRTYLIFFTLGDVFLLIFYLRYKLNRHFKMEEAIKKDTLADLLGTLDIKERHIEFYTAIEKKFGKSNEEDIHKSLATFIYNTIQTKKSKK